MLVFSATALAQIALSLGTLSSICTSAHALGSSPPAPIPRTAPPSDPTLFNHFKTTTAYDENLWGDSIHEDPKDLHRVYFQNLDGLRNDVDDIALYVSTMAQLQVGTFCWADPGLDFSIPVIRNRLQTPIRKHFTSARSAYSSSILPETSRIGATGYQPGGTFTTTTDRWATRSTGTPLLDPLGLGRWSGLRFLGKRGKRLAILTAYRSPRQNLKGGHGFHDQQHALLLSKGIKKPNVRRQFIVDLVKYINTLQSEGYEVLVSLDANETIGQEKDFGLAHLIDECSLLDLHLQASSAPPATYKYGNSRRIDFMLGSAAVADAVIHAGYNAYDNGIMSKHRGIYVDMDFQALMGSVDPITPMKARLLRSDDQPSVDRYLAAFKKYADDHRLWERVKELTTVASSMTTAQCKVSFDAIDRDVTRGMLHAEKKAKRQKGKYEWSPRLREAGLLARYWHLRLREVEKGICLRYAIEHTLNQMADFRIDPDDDTYLDLAGLRLQWKDACQTLRQVRNHAHDIREIHLESQLELYKAKTFSAAQLQAGDGRVNQEKIDRIGKLIANEGMRKPFRAIKAAMTETHTTGLSKLFIPSAVKDPKVAARFCNPDGSVSDAQLIAMAQSDKASVEYVTLLDSEEIEKSLTNYNRDWFRQAKDTPFGHGELFKLVGYDGLTPAATSIIENDFRDHHLPSNNFMQRELQVFIEECRRPDNVATILTEISTEQFIQTVKAWKESTSTSPSGRHLGHYRTAILDPDVASLHTDMLNLPIHHGFAPERWTYSVTPLIEKDDGLPYLTRLRVIHLFEADYNLFLKIIFGRRMVKNAEAAQALNDQQHGSRPRRMTTDALFFSRLEKDMIRQIKSNSAHMDNDATGCYDRIITSLGMMACRRLGMPAHAIRCQADTLKRMKYAVKHIYGTSSTQYTSTDAAPLFGTGQGSGASPAIWLGLVVILLNALDRMSTEDNLPGLGFADPWGDFNALWRVGAFVDDTNQGTMDPDGNLSSSELVENMRLAGQMWERLLHISGGCLNLAKCSWTLQTWRWVNGRPQLAPLDPTDPPLLMTSGDSMEHHIIRQHSNATEVKGLGVHMNFLGTFAHHAATMRSKYDGMARRLRKSTLSASLARKFYHTFYLPSVRYSLPVTSMTLTELHRVQSHMTASVLNKMGYNQHYPHAVAFAPTSVFGCGLVDLRVEQGLTHIRSFLDYVGTESRVGLLMLISLRHLQTEAGVSFDLLANPSPALPYLTDCWILGLRSFCASHGITLTAQRNRIPSISRIGDSMLMDKALTLGLRKQELIDINLVRIYLQVTTVSDIATANGVKIHPFIWKAEYIPDRASMMRFPRQEKPTPYQCGLWRRLLRSLLHPSLPKNMLRLQTPLGPWTAPSTMQWGAMTWDSVLYRRDPYFFAKNPELDGSHISVHFPRAHGIYYDIKPDCYVRTIPAQAVPTDLTGTDHFSIVHSTNQFTSFPKPPTSFHAWIQQLAPAERRLFAAPVYADQCEAEQKLVQYLQLPCTLYIGTDGGKKHHHGSFSWIICSPDHEQLVSNSGPVDGWHKCQSSLRSEVAAIASLTLYLDELVAFNDLITLSCSFQLYVDSTSAITNVTALRDLIPQRRYPHNADLLSTLCLASNVISRFQLTHVHSHQDDDRPFDSLPFAVQLNVLCDQLATEHMKRQLVEPAICTLSSPLRTRGLQVEVKFGTQTISSHYVSRLRECISLATHRTFLQTKYKWDDQCYAHIAWEAFKASARSTSAQTFSVSRSKLVHNWLNLGSQRCKFGDGGTTLEIARCCPYCRQDEDFQHLLTCPHPRALKARYDAMLVLGKVLNKHGAAGIHLRRLITLWTCNPNASITTPTTDPHFGLHPALQRATRTQTQIGWLHLFRGFVSIDWGHIYDPLRLYESKTTKSDCSTKSDKLLTSIVGALQDYTISIWKSRNAILHETGSDNGAIAHAQLNAAISKIYSAKATFHTMLQSYFKRPLVDLLKQSPRQRQRWLRLTKLATSHSSATATYQQLLLTYFPITLPLKMPTSSTPSNDAHAPPEPPIPAQPRHLTQLSLPTCFSVAPDD